MGFVTSHRWCRFASNIGGPEPTQQALRAMLGELTSFIEQTGMRPLSLETVAWRRPEGIVNAGGNDFLCRIRVEVTSGLATRTFRSWIQWQHPVWRWADSASFPERFSLQSAEGFAVR